MRVEDLTAEMREAAGFFSVASAYPASLTPALMWGGSLAEIIKLVMAKALQLGQESRGVIEQSAKNAVDSLAALDLPYIPPSVEGVIDEATKKLGYAAIHAILDAILAEQVQL